MSPLLRCEILPHDLRHDLLDDSNRHDLMEVILDVGRPPHACYFGDLGRRRLRKTEVSEEELEYAQNVIGELGGDNRAGIVGTLHRISAIRNRKGKVIGLTCRVGRPHRENMDMVKDLLEYGKSILFLGRQASIRPVWPGAGKTTVMRGISRVLSDEHLKRVVIVDTSNEIGGDGDIPHPAIGGARRLQVSEPCMQHKVMIEAVENHMPEVIVVDEIGTEAEVRACCTIAQRGVMLIGSAHGKRIEDIGGLKTVVLGDQEARTRNCKKSVIERRADPTFPFLIEMRERHNWVVHRTDKSVDALLQGKKPLVEAMVEEGRKCVVLKKELYTIARTSNAPVCFQLSRESRRSLLPRQLKVTMATETQKLGIKIVKNPPESKLSELGVRSWPKWGCPPSNFPWTYSAKETCYLLKGKVKVYPDGSKEAVEIGAGDLVVFPKGMSCTWDVSEAVDKHYLFE
ncbi:hypothetical protein SASPL_100077 [Salvia splendens]|uniref:AAA+ ATPase domain-containing protein n=1 Tax=Salvia splendens TaxID=180675 RepID=A0A8X9AAM6_SALSN|nr:hypothetical protein SASPL_100077 [Salvia splendens]